MGLLHKLQIFGTVCVVIAVYSGVAFNTVLAPPPPPPPPPPRSAGGGAEQLEAQTGQVELLTQMIEAEDRRIAELERQLVGTSPARLSAAPQVGAAAVPQTPGAEAPFGRLGPTPEGFPAEVIPRCSPTLPETLGIAVNESDLYQCREADIALVHIPKTGGTSIEHAGHRSPLGLRWGFQYERDRFRKIRRGLPLLESKIPACLGNWGKRCCSWWHVPPRQMRDWRPYFGAPNRFCVVRDPYARALSEYSFGHGKDVRKLTCGQLNRTEVNEWLRDRMMQYANGAVAVSDCHWIPQYQYIEPHVGVRGGTVDTRAYDTPDAYIDAGPDGRSCNRVIQLEHLATDLPALMAELGVPEIKLQHGKKAFTSKCKDVGMLEEETRQLIRRIYRQDFVQFGYPL